MKIKIKKTDVKEIKQFRKKLKEFDEFLEGAIENYCYTDIAYYIQEILEVLKELEEK